MNEDFQWNSQTEMNKRIQIQEKISEIIAERNIVPCHTGNMSIFLSISGPLDNYLEGIVKCQCGQKLMAFDGDDNANSLTLLF